jgi:MFS transporter, DHA2 family, multidrug resistance protein
VMLGYPIGPLLGGWMLTHFDWGWVFLINVPVVILGLAAVAVLLPESRSSSRQRIDVGGVVLLAGALALLSYGIINAGQDGWTDRAALAEIVGGALALAVFVIWESRVALPLVDLRLFRSRAFSWGTILSSTVSFAMFGLLFAVPQYFQAVRGADAQGSGIRLLPFIGGMLIGGAVADRLVTRAGVRIVATLGLALLAAGLGFGATTSIATGEAQTLAWIALAGLGLGLVLPTSIDTALGAVPRDTSGVASGVIQAARMVGGSFGAAILGAIINATYQDRLAQTVPAQAPNLGGSVTTGIDTATATGSQPLLHAVREAFVSGMDRAMWVSAALIGIGGLLALTFRSRTGAGLNNEPQDVYDVAA